MEDKIEITYKAHTFCKGHLKYSKNINKIIKNKKYSEKA